MSTTYVSPSLSDTVSALPGGAARFIGHAFMLSHDDGSGTVGSANFCGVRVWDGSAWGLATVNNPVTTTGNIVGAKLIATSEVQLNADDFASPTWTSTFFGFGINSTTNGVDTLIEGQLGHQVGNTDGGYLRIGGGAASGTGIAGGVGLFLSDGGSNNEIGVQVTRGAVSGRRVTWLNTFDLGKGTTTQMPANTGDGVTYVRNASVEPALGLPVGGAELYAAAGTIRVYGTSRVQHDVAARGTLFTGQGRPAEYREYIGQLGTSGSGIGSLFVIDLSTMGDGIYTFDFDVQITNKTTVASAMIKCSGTWQVRSGTLTGVIYPWVTSLVDAAATPTISQGAGGVGAKLDATIASPLLSMDANPGAGNVANDLDWVIWVKMRRMAFT